MKLKVQRGLLILSMVFLLFFCYFPSGHATLEGRVGTMCPFPCLPLICFCDGSEGEAEGGSCPGVISCICKQSSGSIFFIAVPCFSNPF